MDKLKITEQTGPRRIRTSRMWLYELCSASYWECLDIPDVTEAGGPAEAGTIKHAAIAEAVRTGNDALIPDYFGPYVRWIRGFIELGYEVQFELALEMPIAGWILTGHLDVVMTLGKPGAARSACIITDHKTGRVEVDGPDDNLQLLIYTMLVSYVLGYAQCNTAPDAPDHDVIQTIVYQPFAQEAYRESADPFTKQDIWGSDDSVFTRVVSILRRIEDSPKTYNVGGHCAYCPALRTCPMVMPAVVLRATAPPVNLINATPEERAGFAGMVRIAKAFGVSGDKALRSYVMTSGEPIRGEGEELGFVEHEQDEVTVTAPMIDYLHDKFGPRFLEVLKSSKGAIQDLAVSARQTEIEAGGGITETMPRGWMVAASRQVIEDLRELDSPAVTKVIVKKFEWRKTPKQIKGEQYHE